MPRVRVAATGVVQEARVHVLQGGLVVRSRLLASLDAHADDVGSVSLYRWRQEPQSTAIFTTSPDADFASYMPDSIPYKDTKLAIFFETEDMMEETLILLRFNCPDAECGYTASGWGDLKLHTRAVHGKMLW